jgi:adenylate kinase
LHADHPLIFFTKTRTPVVHLSSGDLLRGEVDEGTPLGTQVKNIIARGELVSSAVMVALMKKRMKDHPGKRVLLDGVPRSIENAHDLMAFCGKPELALHLVCDDTVLMERIMSRGAASAASGEGVRADDNFTTALERIRTYHKFHDKTIEWLREQHVPIVNLDCEGPPESVWQQLSSIGKLMRPAVKLPSELLGKKDPEEDWSSDPNRTAI